jgi:hypothetical protein
MKINPGLLTLFVILGCSLSGLIAILSLIGTAIP